MTKKEQPEAQNTETNVEQLQKQLVEKEAALADTKNRLLRALADFDNMKKRSAAEREEIIKFASETMLTALLPIIDNFERAISSAEEHQVNEEFIKGIALIKRQFEDILKRAGLEEIEAQEKKFDPNFHEAVMTKESEQDDGLILEVIQKGYTLFGKLLRPAMVIVNKKQK